jgi:salicylate hydroxylase
MKKAKEILIAGGGIAGLAAALAFVAKGFSVRIFEKAPKFEEIGAGLQLSPNATRLLDRLGVLELLKPQAVRPDAIVLRKAATLSELARVPLGENAERRWKAPYLVAHRADLQNALLDRVSSEPGIRINIGAEVRDATPSDAGITVSVDIAGDVKSFHGLLLVGADGVWSKVRALVAPATDSRFTGELAWRTTVPADGAAGEMLSRTVAQAITAFLHPGAHLIVYPVRAEAAFNLVAFTPGKHVAETWSGKADIAILLNALRGAAAELNQLAETVGPWVVWPIHAVDAFGPWTLKGHIVLIGDAAHAMTPFAAQGAAMAIEDAVTLASAVSETPQNPTAALAGWEAARRPRVLRVARRGALNRFAWHAAGPVALARDLFLKTRSSEALAADFDWLYGWEPNVLMTERPS